MDAIVAERLFVQPYLGDIYGFCEFHCLWFPHGDIEEVAFINDGYIKTWQARMTKTASIRKRPRTA
jgi:hypothetical protein